MFRVISFLLIAGLTLFAATGCDGNGGGEENLASVSIALGSFTSEGVPLYLQNNKGFRLKIYKSSPHDKNEKPYYDTGCKPYGGDLFSVQGIPVGSNRAIMFEGYTSITEIKSGEWRCDNLAFFGLRGEIEVNETDPNSFYFIPVFTVGGFTSFPVWRQDLVNKASSIFCTSDKECQMQVDCAPNEGCVKKYLLHPLATCDKIETRCEFKVTQFPLNMKEDRAFHTSHSFDDGRVLIAGGLNRSLDNEFYAENPALEFFDAGSSLFSERLISGLTIQHAFHTSHLINGDTVILIGGAQKLKISSLFTDKTLFFFPKEFCTNSDDCGLNLLSSATVIDFSSMKYNKTNLTFSAAKHLSELVQGADKNLAILVAGGYSQVDKNTITPSNLGATCTVGNDLSLKCTGTDSPLSVSRASAAGVCVNREGELCSEYLIIGGNEEGKGDLAEIFLSNGMKFLPLTSSGTSVKSIIGSEIVEVDGKYYMFGGISEIKDKGPDMLPMQIIVDSTNGSVTFKEINAGNPQDPDLYRILHKVTKLDDNSIIVTGGLNKDLKPAASALLFKYENGTLNFGEKISMKSGRFGHSAVLITSGALKGALLVTGGLTTDQQGKFVFARGAELYYPPTK